MKRIAKTLLVVAWVAAIGLWWAYGQYAYQVTKGTFDRLSGGETVPREAILTAGDYIVRRLSEGAAFLMLIPLAIVTLATVLLVRSERTKQNRAKQA